MKDYNTQNVSVLKFVLFLLCPFLSFLYSLRDATSKSSYIIFFLFGVLFCWHMSPQQIGVYDDLVGIIDNFNSSNYITWNYIVDQTKSILSFQFDEQKEIYEIFLIWLSKNISDNYHLFFAIAAVAYLYFMLKSLKFITDSDKYRNCIECVVILALFVMPRDIITVQNPRFTTGMWMIVFAVLSYFINGYKKKYLLFVLVAPLIHSAFYFFWIVACLILCINKFNQGALRTLWLCSIPFAFMNLTIMSSVNINFLPSYLSDWVYNYISDDSFALKVSGEGISTGLLVFMRETVCRIVYFYVLYRIFYIENGLSLRLKNWILCFSIIVNFIQFIPELGSRFWFMQKVLVIIAWFYAFYPRDKYIILLLLFSNIGHIAERYFIRTLHFVTDYEIFYGNIFMILFDTI